jgi:gliding motility-associated-like protein
VAKTDQNLCAPLQNGNVSVTGITEIRNATPTPAANLALFGFQWFDAGGVAHPSTPTFVNGASAISNLLAGTYSVQVRNALGCTSTATASIVEDLTVLPAITLDNYLNPTICILPETPGFLQVSADNSLNFADYTFEWFDGPDESGTLVEPNNATLGNITYNQPLQYTVRVTNIATNCVNLDTYRFDVDTVDVQVLASAVARTNCLADNGSLFATTLNGAGALYNYEWYAGPSVGGSPLYTTKDVQGVPIGQYTVVAVNPTHAFCTSGPYTIDVPDARVLPPVVAVQKSPLTYCDPANPNGVAFATVEDGVTGYTFDWFQGSVAGAPFYSGSEVTGLAATTYVVRATDVVTGCDNTASIQIENDPVKVPAPTVVVVSHLTDCVDPDGILSASVNGITAGYLLQWYNGQSVKNNNDATGAYYRDLDKGFYTTTATDNESGCVSDPVVTEVLPFQETPDFEIATEPTNCEQNIGEATLVPLNNVPIFTVEWDINGAAEFGTMLSDLPKGEFTVTATSYKQCVTSKTFEIQPEVLVFNGISRNNDGQNDYFEIACIQDFPANNVKIFDRAGTLVYEANGYDNQDVFFDGISNRGINLLGRDLPDGTYFYIIDKRDGSEPRTGYLELLSN